MSDAARTDAVHRLRIPFGNSEIELVVQVSQRGEIRIGGQAVPLQHSAPFVLAPGGQVGKYVLEDKVGQGSFGMVYTALDPELDRRVAIKILNPSNQLNEDVLHRFLQEARASARIAHPGIVTVLDSGKVATCIGDSAYIVFELLQGESLANRIARGGRLPLVTAIEIARQIAAALDAAHRVGVLHRDLKSENVHLVPDSAVHSGERVKILDFGLAKLGTSQHTDVGTVFGTPRYMSPEQCRSAASVDQRSDIYSLGCILFELVTGCTPFAGELRQQLESHLQLIPPRASQLVPDVPPALDELIAQMLAKDPGARPQSMAEVHAALQYHHGASPYTAATMLPVEVAPAPVMPAPVIDAPVFPPRVVPRAFPAQPTREHGPSARASALAAAIVFVILAGLTAMATRGHMRNAEASPPAVTAPGG